ncbi:signal peptide peptidase SppA [Luteimonas abyssi]|uniref:signal peptide peptidase SppA n=1 Tax=Luteimonas abyssi TaxID=1247514 RepID=UPI000737D7D1|nr:signal peptide peptidase SppA [Luteimonas abyssi]
MNQPRRRGPIARVLVGVWDAVNFSRRLVLNLLFLLVVLLFVALLASREGAKPLLDRTTLVIAPEGRIVEQYSVDPTSRMLARAMGQPGPGEIQLRDLLRALDAAAHDDNIERVYLRLDGLLPSGMATMREVAAGVRAVRDAGKQVVAYGQTLPQSSYLLAAQADEVYVDPMGSGVPLEGLSSYGLYFGEALQEKLSVDVHVFKVGEFKSAVEPFILNAASDEAKEADLYWLSDLWQRYLADIAQARGLDLGRIEAGIDGMADGVAAVGGDLARYAQEQGLVDGLMAEHEVETLLTERGVADEDDDLGFRNVGLDGYLAHVDRNLPSAMASRPQVAVVVAEGTIVDGERPPGSVGGVSTAALLREAREDDDVRAVVLRVNSPGGSAYASEQINREIELLKAAGKPVVASMGYVAASGGYWISMNADRIYADPSTITGSIGVFGMIPNLTRSLGRMGVYADGVGTTRFAGSFNLTRPMEPDVGRLIQSSIERIYGDFVGKVAAGRGRTPEQIDAVARGRVWSGAQARDRGLVDDLGGLREAIADAARRVELDEDTYRVRYVEQPLSPFAQFLSGFGGSRLGAALFGDTAFARALAVRALPEMERHLETLEQGMDQPAQGRVRPMTYCFCPTF